MDPGIFPDDDTYNGPHNYYRLNQPVKDLRERKRERERERDYD